MSIPNTITLTSNHEPMTIALRHIVFMQPHLTNGDLDGTHIMFEGGFGVIVEEPYDTVVQFIEAITREWEGSY